MGFVAIQPNGLITRFNTICDCPSSWNMTVNEYAKGYNHTLEDAKDTIENYALPFDDVVKRYFPHNMNLTAFKSFLKDVGFNDEIADKIMEEIVYPHVISFLRDCGYDDSEIESEFKWYVNFLN